MKTEKVSKTMRTLIGTLMVSEIEGAKDGDQSYSLERPSVKANDVVNYWI